MTIDMRTIRARNADLLAGAGFRFADWLPVCEPESPPVRPAAEVVKRLAALEAVCLYVAAHPGTDPEPPLREMINAHGIDDFLTEDDAAILALPRDDAFEQNQYTIGWRMENMVPLAWALGHGVEPRIDGQMIGGDDLSSILTAFAPRDAQSCGAMLATARLRPAAEILAMEDLFYCAHNAVRTAQFNDPTSVPPGFDPVASGGVIHERRHALTWITSPGIAWSDTDLST